MLVSHIFYLIEHINPPKCINCNKLLSVKHILTECSSFDQTRHWYYSFTDVNNIFNHTPIQNILNFIKKINNFCLICIIYLQKSLTKFSPLDHEKKVVSSHLSPRLLTSYNRHFVIKSIQSEQVAEMHRILTAYHQVCTHCALQCALHYI